MTRRDPSLSVSQVTRAGSMPSEAANGRDSASIWVAWPRRRADGRTTYPMWPPISRRNRFSTCRIDQAGELGRVSGLGAGPLLVRRVRVRAHPAVLTVGELVPGGEERRVYGGRRQDQSWHGSSVATLA